MENTKKLYRSRTDKILGGVCGGLAQYFGIDAVLLRIGFVIFALADGVGIILYIILVIIIPNEPGDDVDVDRMQKTKDFAGEVGKRAQTFADDVRQRTSSSDRRNFIGFVIIGLGVLLLIQRILPSMWFEWRMVWPVVIIIIGIVLLFKRNNHHG
ncbi:MAG: PspC domain-containing protein [Patescibacteria group bacterium]|jgi:phage shock protein C